MSSSQKQKLVLSLAKTKETLQWFVAHQNSTLCDNTLFLGTCYGLNCAPQRAVTPNVAVLGEKAFRRLLRLNEVLKVRF